MGSGRPPKQRDNYMGDAQVLLQLARAVRADDTRSIDWRNEVEHELTRLATRLINAPTNEKENDPEAA